MNNGRWLEKNQYTCIKRKGKELGADYVDTKYLYHCAAFNHAIVWFAFRPFFCGASLRPKEIGRASCRERVSSPV